MFLYKKPLGFTLIELMLSLCISMAMIGATMEAYLVLNHAANFERAVSSIQIKALQAKRFLTLGLMHAGYAGCFNLTSGSVINHTGNSRYNFNRNLVLLNDQHAIQAKYITDLKPVLHKMVNQHEIILPYDKQFKKNKVIFITDCKHAEIALIQKTRKIRLQPKLKIWIMQALSKQYDTNAKIGLLVVRKYFIEKVSYQASLGNQAALFVQGVDAKKHELVPGIKNLTIKSYTVEATIKAIMIHFNVISDNGRMKKLWRLLIAIKH